MYLPVVNVFACSNELFLMGNGHSLTEVIKIPHDPDQNIQPNMQYQRSFWRK